MNKLVFFQPALPKYRDSFYERLQKKIELEVIVYASKKDFLGVNSIETSYIKVVGSFIKIGPFFWQKGLGMPKLSKNDIVVISGNPRIVNYMLLLILYRVVGVKTIWWGQGWTASSRGIGARIRRLIMNLADGVLVYTEKECENINVVPPIVGLNNGLDLNEIIDIKDKVSIRKLNSPLSLLFIGRLTNKSGIENIINTIIDLNVDINLTIIGDFSGFMASFPELYNESLMSNRVSWLGAIYEEKGIAAVAKDCDYFIYGGSVGLSLIHAFCYYLPAIVHDNEKNHMPEFAAFQEGYNGFSFKENDDDSLSNLLLKLSGKENYKLRLNSRMTVEKTFNINDMVERFVSLKNKI